LALIHIDIFYDEQFVLGRATCHELDQHALPNRDDGGQNLADAD